MKSGTSKTSGTNSISMIPPSNDDLKAIHSIEAILGIKNIGNHHHHQQHLFPSHLLPSSKFYHPKLGNKKRSSSGLYPESKLYLIIDKKKIYFKLGKAMRRISDETDPLSISKSIGNSEDDVEDLDDEDDNDSNDRSLSNHHHSSKKKHRRNRTTFTTFQLHELERAFDKSRRSSHFLLGCIY